jgi:AraC-like DNA-binding protein
MADAEVEPPARDEYHAGVTEVAKRVGYDAEAAFSKVFKRWIGVPPGAYRRASGQRGALFRTF